MWTQFFSDATSRKKITLCFYFTSGQNSPKLQREIKNAGH